MEQKHKLPSLEENYGKNILPLSLLENDDLAGTKPMEIIGYYKKEITLPRAKEIIFKAIEHYNLFSSRLIMIGDNKFALQYCNDGFVYNVLPSINVTSDNINIDDIKKMMVHVKTLPGEPLFAITIIPLKDALLGGFSCSHAIGDGISLMLFGLALGCIVDNNSFPLPSRQRLFEGDPIRSDQIDKVFMPPFSALSHKIQNKVNRINNIKTYTTREYFTDEFLNEIKIKAKSENEHYVISNHQVITSFLLKKYHNRLLPDTDRIVLRTPVNVRDIHPPLIDSLYIGNAYFDSTCEFTKEEIDKMSLSEIAYRLKKSIAAVRDENFIKKAAFLSEYGIEFNPDIFKDYPTYDVDKDIVLSNLTHLNDIESMGLGTSIGSIVYISPLAQTGFTMLKESKGTIFAEITSMHPLT